MCLAKMWLNAGNCTTAGKLKYIHEWCDDITEFGGVYGGFDNSDKIWLFIKKDA